MEPEAKQPYIEVDPVPEFYLDEVFAVEDLGDCVCVVMGRVVRGEKVAKLRLIWQKATIERETERRRLMMSSVIANPDESGLRLN